MIEFHTDPSKSYFQRSMINLLEGYPKLPVNVIVEPFLK